MEKKYLIINLGSASKKYAVFGPALEKEYCAHFEMEDGHYIVTESYHGQKEKKNITPKNYQNAQAYLLDSLIFKKIIALREDISAIGIRIVAPGEYFLRHRIINKEYLKMAKKTLKKVPLHLGPALEEIKITQKIFRGVNIVGVSDSVFHKTMLTSAKYYAIPILDSRRLGLQKFGYHGTSIQSVISQVKKRLGQLPARVVVCHLGSGASVTAVKDGRSLDTSMGFTPLDGVVMATRVGEIDPGAVIYLAEELNLNNKNLEKYFNNKCGLLGLSGKSSDVRDLLKFEKEGDQDSALALDVYAYRLKKYISGAAAVLGGVDLLVFAGIVGERSFIMRERICRGLEFLGLNLDITKNNKTEGIEAEISTDNSQAKILVAKTDEIEEIAKETLATLNSSL